MHSIALNIIAIILTTFLLSGIRTHPDGDRIIVEIIEPKIDDHLRNDEIKLNDKTKTTKTFLSHTDDESYKKVTYHGSQLWKVATDDDNDKKRVISRLRENSDISMWGGDLTHLDILVKNQSLNAVRDELRTNQINYDVIIDDIQRAIDEANPPIDDDDELQIRQGHRMTWKAYHRLEDIHGYLDYLSESYPKLCKVITIGKSIQGRELKVLKISNGAVGNKAIWIDGGIHAREWISPATVTYIINYLVLNYDRESFKLQNLDWYFLPVANPDGYEHSHATDRLWRKNRNRNGACYGTDLNRNYGYRWGGKGSGRNPCTDIYGGTGPFSEPETAAIKNFVTGQNANWKASISFHSYGQFILYPWGYDKLVPPDHKDLHVIAQRAAAAIAGVSGANYRIGPAGNTLYPASGGSDDWAKGAIGMKYAYTIELRDQGRYGFVLPAVYIEPTAAEALAATRVIAEAASLA